MLRADFRAKKVMKFKSKPKFGLNRVQTSQNQVGKAVKCFDGRGCMKLPKPQKQLHKVNLSFNRGYVFGVKLLVSADSKYVSKIDMRSFCSGFDRSSNIKNSNSTKIGSANTENSPKNIYEFDDKLSRSIDEMFNYKFKKYLDERIEIEIRNGIYENIIKKIKTEIRNNEKNDNKPDDHGPSMSEVLLFGVFVLPMFIIVVFPFVHIVTYFWFGVFAELMRMCGRW